MIFDLEADFKNNHRVELSVTPFNRNSQVLITKNIEVDDQTILLGADASSKISNTIYDFEYGYSFKASENGKLQAILGLYWMNSEFQLNASGFIKNENENAEFNNDFIKVSNFNAPLPLFGLRYHYQINQDWKVIGHGKYFNAEIGNVDGTIISGLLATEYRWLENWTIGGSISYFDLDVTEFKENYVSQLKWKYSSLNMYFTFHF